MGKNKLCGIEDSESTMMMIKSSKSDFPGWPSRDNKIVMELVGNLHAIAHAHRWGVNRDIDELGPYEGVHFVDAKIGPVALISYNDGPPDRYFVLVDKEADQSAATARLRQVLDIEDSQIAWPAIQG